MILITLLELASESAADRVSLNIKCVILLRSVDMEERTDSEIAEGQPGSVCVGLVNAANQVRGLHRCHRLR